MAYLIHFYDENGCHFLKSIDMHILISYFQTHFCLSCNAPNTNEMIQTILSYLLSQRSGGGAGAGGGEPPFVSRAEFEALRAQLTSVLALPLASTVDSTIPQVKG